MQENGFPGKERIPKNARKHSVHCPFSPCECDLYCFINIFMLGKCHTMDTFSVPFLPMCALMGEGNVWLRRYPVLRYSSHGYLAFNLKVSLWFAYLQNFAGTLAIWKILQGHWLFANSELTYPIKKGLVTLIFFCTSSFKMYWSFCST